MTQSGFALTIAIYALACMVAFWRGDPQRAAIIAYLAGWLLLPVGLFPPSRYAGEFARLDIMPLVLPSRMLVSKAAIIPMVVCLASLMFDFARWRGFRPRPVDAVVLAFCLYPLAQAAAVASRPDGVSQALYLLAVWGGSWLLGRLYLTDETGPAVFLKGMTWAGLGLVPVAVIELVASPVLYEWLYGPHPYRPDGMERYIGYRPLGFFENGNQYGLWVALAAVAGIAVARSDIRYRPAAGLLVLAALASQSVGAIGLMMLGAAALFTTPAIRRTGAIVAATGAAVGVLAIGAAVTVASDRVLALGIQAFRMVGRGSFPWRVSQDLKALAAIGDRWLLGTGQWDWWIERASRPWDLPMLVVGQMGVIGLLLLLPIAVVPVLCLFAPGAARLNQPRVAVAILAVIAVLDALLNAFICFPAILIAGGLVGINPAPAPLRRTSRHRRTA